MREPVTDVNPRGPTFFEPTCYAHSQPALLWWFGRRQVASACLAVLQQQR